MTVLYFKNCIFNSADTNYYDLKRAKKEDMKIGDKFENARSLSIGITSKLCQNQCPMTDGQMTKTRHSFATLSFCFPLRECLEKNFIYDLHFLRA